MRRSAGGIALALAACGGGGGGTPDAGPAFEVVGHTDLGARGMNAALAVAGDTVYVGSRIDQKPIAIVDVSDPAAPDVVGEIGAPEEALVGMTSRELRAIPDLDLLIVLNFPCSPELHGCTDPPAEGSNLRFYDISDRHAPALLSRYAFSPGSPLRPNTPHEMFVWTDGDRVLVHVATPANAPEYEIVDASDPAAPVRMIAWDPIVDGGLGITRGDDNYLHSASVSADGKSAYFSHLQGGVFVVDLETMSVVTEVAGIVDWSPPEPAGPHSAVPVPGRDLLVVTDEVYPPPWNTGCPYGWLRVVDISDPTTLVVTGELKLDENQPSFCDEAPEGASFTAHNATTTAHLALVSWHSAGLIAVDLTDPAAPTALAAWRPDPIASVDVEDPGLGGDPVTVWSYPVIQDGLIYVIDIRNGLYVLRYTGPYAEELDVPGPVEGNSVQ